MNTYEIRIDPISITADSKEQAIEYAMDYFKDKNFMIDKNEVYEV